MTFQRKTIIKILAIVLLFSSSILAQGIYLTGRVITRNGGDIEGATVRFLKKGILTGHLTAG
jgi:hypothetical protein